MLQTMHRVVLFMDKHGVFLTAVDPDNPGCVLVGQRRHQKLSDAVRTALEENGAFPLQINEDLLEPNVFWGLRMRIELAMPKNMEGKVVREELFHERVNLRLLREVAPAFMRGLDRRACIKIAQRVREIRKDASRHKYILETEMHSLVRELPRQWKLYLTTAGAFKHTVESLPLNTPGDHTGLFARVFMTESVGIPKTHQDFWTKIATLAKVHPSQCVAIEDNLLMGIKAVRAGMSVIYIDRGYGIEGFIRDELKGKIAGVSLSRVSDTIPPNNAQFIVCVKSIAGLKFCLQRAAGSNI